VQSRPEFAKVFELAKIRCKRYPNCLEVHPLSEIEHHEKIGCKNLPCKQCNRNLKKGTVSMQAHLQLHCEETKMQCEFCKMILPRRELASTHTCSAVFSAKDFAITHAMVVNSELIPNDFTNITTCYFCGNYLRKP